MGGTYRKSLRGVTTLFTMHGHEPAESWAEIVPQVVHVHGKFYEIDETGQEPSIDIPSIMKLFVDVGYISSEWGDRRSWTSTRRTRSRRSASSTISCQPRSPGRSPGNRGDQAWSTTARTARDRWCIGSAEQIEECRVSRQSSFEPASS